jgi:hypothetical protein
MFRTCSASLCQMLRRSFPRPVKANARIVGGCAFRVRVLSDRLAAEVDRLQQV